MTVFISSNVSARIRFNGLKDRHQWSGCGFRCSLSLDMDKLFPKVITYIYYIIR